MLRIDRFLRSDTQIAPLTMATSTTFLGVKIPIERRVSARSEKTDKR
jgi:hypothetical protein